mmetsp:Transcript_83200/g.185895  ORF Transcript_83200/g.185895 Transcript_83200/m.185895 type:complete len:338 (+) Transcript_83200:44-1057(+)
MEDGSPHLVSGVFGQSINRTSLVNMCCYTIGTVILTCVLMDSVSSVLFETGEPVSRIGGWYLLALFLWRITISPLYHVGTRICNVPSWIIFIFIFVAAGFTLQSISVAHEQLLYFRFPYALQILTLAPYFAAGHLLSVQDWSRLLFDRRLVVLGGVVVMAWYAGLTFSHWFQGFNIHAGCGNHWPVLCLREDSFKISSWFWVHAQRLPIVLAAICMLGGFADLLQYLPLGWFSKVVFDCGTRTLYAYVLLPPLFTTPAKNTFDCLLSPFQTSRPYWICTSSGPMDIPGVFLGIWAVLVLNSRFSELIFSWAVMPFWLKDAFDMVCGVKRHDASSGTA